MQHPARKRFATPTYANASTWLRTALSCLPAVASLWGSIAHAGEVTTAYASPIPISGNSSFMVSHRDQRQSWQTADGAIHILVNVGTIASGASGSSLAMYSSFDGGATWNLMFTLADTHGSPTSDGFLTTPATNDSSQVLDFVYSSAQTGTANADVVFATATYEPLTQSWIAPQPPYPQTIAASATLAGLEPTLTADALGNLWCSFTSTPATPGAPPAGTSSQIQLLYLPAAAADWQSVDVDFSYAGAHQRVQQAPRLLTIAGAVAVLYQSGTSLFWSTLPTGSAITDWSPVSLVTDKLTVRQGSSTDTGYSAVATPSGETVLLAFTEKTTVAYTLYDAAANTWSSPRNVAPPTTLAIYVKTSVVNGSLWMAISDGTKGTLLVYESANDETFTQVEQILSTYSSPGAFDNPRIEAPAYAFAPVPVWQQFADEQNATQGLLYPVPQP